MFRLPPDSARKSEMLDEIRSRCARHPRWTLALVTLAALLPFLAKPFNIDDPLFLWTAKQIQVHPANFYSFSVNWYGEMQPMWSVTENPPLAGYYLALAATILGWSETALHFAFVLPAVAAVLGTYRLAKIFCAWPMLAALATLLTPVFLVSATTVMCDVPMLAFWVWATVFWIEGIEKNNSRKLFFSALLIALAALTKYFGACLIPLLVVYALAAKRKFDWQLLWLLLPVVTLCGYQIATLALYGHGGLSEATGYAAYAKGFLGFSGLATALTALTFTGGCLATAFFFTPLLWRARTQAALIVGAIVVAAILLPTVMAKYDPIQGVSRTLVEFQIVFWAAGGVGVLALTVAEIWERRDAQSWLLALWVCGTFLFAALFNWTVNGRSLLPMAPALGILLARRLEKKFPAGAKIVWPRGATICLAAGAVLSLLVARADFSLAVADRQSAQQVCAKCGQGPGAVFFQGHWGFQYYMQQQGATALDVRHSRLQPGDCLVVPVNNTSLFPVNSETTAQREIISVAGPDWLTTWSAPAGAGFYAAARGPLPFAFGNVPTENVIIYDLKPAAK